MSILRRDDSVVNTLGNAIAGAEVYYLGPQPVDVATLTPLLPVYGDTSGTPATNPQITDGFGHAVAYLNDGALFTAVYIYPNGMQVVYPDQFVGASSGGSTPFSGVPQGTIDGTNKVFTMVNGNTPLGSIPLQSSVAVNFPLIPGLGYTLAVVAGEVQITFANAPQTGDALWAQGLL